MMLPIQELFKCSFLVELILKDILWKVVDNFHCPKKVFSTVPSKEVFIILHFVGSDSFVLKANLLLNARPNDSRSLNFKKWSFKLTGRFLAFLIPVEGNSHFFYELSIMWCVKCFIHGKTVNTLHILNLVKSLNPQLYGYRPHKMTRLTKLQSA